MKRLLGKLLALAVALTVSPTQGFRYGGRFHHQQKSSWRPLLASSTSAADDYCPLPSVLPVFPVRKSVKLPTETLTLNLYEDRYLAMSDYILAQNNSPLVFGAIYGSDKPQMVPGGEGPIVPLYEPGDVGTLFAVQRVEEGTRKSTGGRKVQIVGVGTRRFRIQKILHNGYGGGGDDAGEGLPFVLVEPSPVEDVALVTEEERKQFGLFQQELQAVMDSVDLEEDMHTTTTRTKEEGEEAASEGGPESQVVMVTTVAKFTAPDFWRKSSPSADDNRSPVEKVYMDELFTFAAFLILAPNATPGATRTFLRMNNPLERAKYLMEGLVEDGQWKR